MSLTANMHRRGPLPEAASATPKAIATKLQLEHDVELVGLAEQLARLESTLMQIEDRAAPYLRQAIPPAPATAEAEVAPDTQLGQRIRELVWTAERLLNFAHDRILHRMV